MILTICSIWRFSFLAITYWRYFLLKPIFNRIPTSSFLYFVILFSFSADTSLYSGATKTESFRSRRKSFGLFTYWNRWVGIILRILFGGSLLYFSTHFKKLSFYREFDRVTTSHSTIQPTHRASLFYWVGLLFFIS